MKVIKLLSTVALAAAALALATLYSCDAGSGNQANVKVPARIQPATDVTIPPVSKNDTAVSSKPISRANVNAAISSTKNNAGEPMGIKNIKSITVDVTGTNGFKIQLADTSTFKNLDFCKWMKLSYTAQDGTVYPMATSDYAAGDKVATMISADGSSNYKTIISKILQDLKAGKEGSINFSCQANDDIIAPVPLSLDLNVIIELDPTI